MNNKDASKKRELNVISFLNEFPWDTSGVIIGGYAIAAYGKPRYSDDIDIVISEESLDKVREFLNKDGFISELGYKPNPNNYTGSVSRFVNGAVTLDLLVGSVRDREAQIDIPESWISFNKRRIKLKTIESSTKVKVSVARPEAICALKLQAGRDQDISDIFTIRKEIRYYDDIKKIFL